jgi:hypothetical protein
MLFQEAFLHPGRDRLCEKVQTLNEVRATGAMYFVATGGKLSGATMRTQAAQYDCPAPTAQKPDSHGLFRSIS